MKRLFCLIGKKSALVASIPRPRLITSREVKEARGPHTCSRPCAFEEKKIGGEKKNTKKSTPPKTHHEIHSSPATATTSTRRATKHVTHVSPYSPASIDPGFVENGLVQLSQSVITTNVTHTQTYQILAPCTHPGMKRLFCLKVKNDLGRFAPSALLRY